MAKGPLITNEIIQLIARVYLEHPEWRAKEIQNEVNTQLRKRSPRVNPDWPGLNAVQKALTKIRKRDNERPSELKELDMPWSTASLAKYPVSPEALPAVLKAWVWLPENINLSLTIREALWVGRLYAAIEDMPTLLFVAQVRAGHERVNEVTGVDVVRDEIYTDYFLKSDLGIFGTMTGQTITTKRRNKIFKVIKEKRSLLGKSLIS